MPLLTTDTAEALRAAHQPPCVSVYLPAPPTYPDARQTPILCRDLLRQAEERLRQLRPGAAVRALLRPFEEHLDTTDFVVQHRHGGLALFGSPDSFTALDLPRAVPAGVFVAGSFHVKPLLRLLQTTDRFQVLGVTAAGARLFEGDRDALHEVELRGLPAGVGAAGGPLSRSRVAGGTAAAGAVGMLAGGPVTGVGSKSETEQFFRVVDRVVWENHSRASGLPLILAALPENQPVFRAVSHNPRLLPTGIERNPDALSADELRQAAWRILEPHEQERTAKAVEAYEIARSRGLATDDLEEAAQAAHGGRVGTLLLDADRRMPGSLDLQTGAVRPIDPAAPGAEDVFDDLAEVVLRMKGEVVVLPAAAMPTATGLAAVFRY